MSSPPSLADLDKDPHPFWHEARAVAPLVWVDSLDGWVVVARDLAVTVMRDAHRFTVDDPRFSTGRILGPSMLSTDGPTHARHRAPFVAGNTARATERDMGPWVRAEAARLVAELGAEPELRAQLATPLAVNTIVHAIGLDGLDPDQLLGWYRTIVAEVEAISRGASEFAAGAAAYAHLAAAVIDSYSGSRGDLNDVELAANVAVMLFGAIETSEGATANACHHLLSHPDSWQMVVGDRSLVANAVDESLRLEPSASVVDRYATIDLEIEGTKITGGDFVQVSLAAANRDPQYFADPDCYDILRTNARSSATFAFGPHACLGIHLARMETIAAISALAAARPELTLNATASGPPTGIVFRKPVAVQAYS